MTDHSRSVLDFFRDIAAIPHCSHQADGLKDWLIAICESLGYEASTDAAGNIMARSRLANPPKVTLQSHYDMVCIGEAPRLHLEEKDGWLSARNSSLGADNGMGIAISLYLMQNGANIDALFTANEEVGLLGANDLQLPVRTPYMLNLDSEDEGEICIGCAGGVDIFARKKLQREPLSAHWELHTLTADCPGGHSGVNIDDNIPSAIMELARVLAANPQARLLQWTGGERINAIPRHAEAVIVLPPEQQPVVDNAWVKHHPGGQASAAGVIVDDRQLIDAIHGFAHGVRGWNKELNLPQDSINLADIDTMAGDKGDELHVSLSARSMSNQGLHNLKAQTLSYFRAHDFELHTDGKYPAWKPDINEFSHIVRDVYRRHVPEADFAGIHAGLECAVFADKFPELKITSIGPTIVEPHSDRERVDLTSVDKITQVVAGVVAQLEMDST